MMQDLSALGVSTGVSPVRNLAPPRGFRAASQVNFATMESEGPWGKSPSRAKRGAKGAGLRYERRALSLLKECFPGLLTNQWFKFFDAERLPRWCQTDGLLLCKDGAIIFEVKIRGTGNAWFQLDKLYRPVVEKATGLPVRALVQICGAFDPAIPYPCEVFHLSEIGIDPILSSSKPGLLLCYSWRV